MFMPSIEPLFVDEMGSWIALQALIKTIKLLIVYFMCHLHIEMRFMQWRLQFLRAIYL